MIRADRNRLMSAMSALPVLYDTRNVSNLLSHIKASAKPHLPKIHIQFGHIPSIARVQLEFRVSVPHTSGANRPRTDAAVRRESRFRWKMPQGQVAQETQNKYKYLIAQQRTFCRGYFCTQSFDH